MSTQYNLVNYNNFKDVIIKKYKEADEKVEVIPEVITKINDLREAINDAIKNRKTIYFVATRSAMSVIYAKGTGLFDKEITKEVIKTVKGLDAGVIKDGIATTRYTGVYSINEKIKITEKLKRNKEEDDLPTIEITTTDDIDDINNINIDLSNIF